MALHLVYSSDGWTACLPMRSDDDVVVLLGDGVYVNADDDHVSSLLDDVKARALKAERTVTYDALVDLVVEHAPVVSWS